MDRLDELFAYVTAMRVQNVKHRTKSIRLGCLDEFDQYKHLRDEVDELALALDAAARFSRSPDRYVDVCQEIADVLGVVIDMAVYQGMTANSLLATLAGKLKQRFYEPMSNDRQFESMAPKSRCHRCGKPINFGVDLCQLENKNGTLIIEIDQHCWREMHEPMTAEKYWEQLSYFPPPELSGAGDAGRNVFPR